MIAFLGTGCQSDLQSYIDAHTAVEQSYGTDEQIILAIEDSVDIDESAILEMLWAQRRVAEIIPDDDGLKHVTVFLPATEDSYIAVRKCIIRAGDNPGVAFSAPRSRTVVFRPRTWHERPLEYVVETYIHELMHYVALKIDGDMDAGHKRPEYWGKGGLVAIILEEWKISQSVGTQ